uniref:uncharacterized protein isoform X1 n=1 Tax=Myxine glutinosa TaxID=7769 RepID=UPI0035902BED
MFVGGPGTGYKGSSSEPVERNTHSVGVLSHSDQVCAMSLSGSTALITDAAGGLGAAMADSLLRRGAKSLLKRSKNIWFIDYRNQQCRNYERGRMGENDCHQSGLKQGARRQSACQRDLPLTGRNPHDKLFHSREAWIYFRHSAQL